MRTTEELKICAGKSYCVYDYDDSILGCDLLDWFREYADNKEDEPWASDEEREKATEEACALPIYELGPFPSYKLSTAENDAERWFDQNSDLESDATEQRRLAAAKLLAPLLVEAMNQFRSAYQTGGARVTFTYAELVAMDSNEMRSGANG
jgi:hypothetical protein